jgi:hypothetical protein
MTTCAQPATGARTSHYYVLEDECGVTPTNPDWKKIRYTSGNLQLTKDALQSAELDGSREIADLRLGQNQTSGELSVELNYNTYGDLLEAALGGTWVTGASGVGVEITVSSAAKTFTRTAGDFVADGVQVGQIIQFEDLVNGDNAKPVIVTAVAPTQLNVQAELTDEGPVNTDYSASDRLSVGGDRRSFSILTHFADADGGAGEYHIITGVEITAYSFDIAVNAMVTGTFSTIGRTYQADVALPAGSTFAAVDSFEPFSGVDAKLVDVTDPLNDFAYVTQCSVSLDNGASAQFELGSNDTSFIEQGRANSTLSLTSFFVDSTNLSRFVNEQELSLTVKLVSTTGSFAFYFSRIVYTSGTPEVGGEGSVTQSFDAQALKGAGGFTSVAIERLAAAA